MPYASDHDPSSLLNKNIEISRRESDGGMEYVVIDFGDELPTNVLPHLMIHALLGAKQDKKDRIMLRPVLKSL